MRCRKTWREIQCFFSELKEQRTQEQGCDVTVRVDDQAFPSHSWLLAASCPYFKAMFTSNTEEAASSTEEPVSCTEEPGSCTEEPVSCTEELEVYVNEMTPDTFKIIWDYIYGTEVEIKDENEAISIVEGAQFLGMDHLYSSAIEILKSLLNTNNVVHLLGVADQLGIAELEAAALTHACGNFEAVVPRPEFLEMSLDHFSDLISRDELKVTKEELVYEAVRSWTAHDDRQQHLPDLLEKVRLALLSLEYLQKELATDDSLFAYPKCIRLIQHAKDYHVPQLRNMVPAHLYQPRNCFSKNIAQFQPQERSTVQTPNFPMQEAPQSTPASIPQNLCTYPRQPFVGATAAPLSRPWFPRLRRNFAAPRPRPLPNLARLTVQPSSPAKSGQQSNTSKKPRGKPQRNTRGKKPSNQHH